MTEKVNKTNSLDWKQGGVIITGGVKTSDSMATRTETYVVGVGKLSSETPSRTESVVITNA